MKTRFGMVVLVLILAAAFAWAGGQQEEPQESADAVSSMEMDAAEELYSLLPKIALVGVRDDSALESRADIDKAWPKTPRNEGTLFIGWSEIAMANPWFVAVRDSAIATAEEKGYEINFLVAEGDNLRQSDHIDTFITQGVDVIVIDPVDTTSVILDIQRAVDAGIPVVTVGAAPSGEALS
jgi:ribose transport system substrate-binding protein